MTFDPARLEGREPYHLGTSLVVPRPIAWVSTVSSDGVHNLAPHSYFNMMSSKPLIVHFTSTGVKDTLRNCRETGEFVVNLVSRSFAEKMNLTAADFPADISEFDWASLEQVPSEKVAPPRVDGVAAAMECRVEDIISKGNGNMVFGEVVAIHVSEEVWRNGRVDPRLYDPIGRMGGSTYTRAAAELFDLRRPTYDELAGGSAR
ncbi:MAG: flavin reductase family protein [Actinomycetota bacterium]